VVCCCSLLLDCVVLLKFGGPCIAASLLMEVVGVCDLWAALHGVSAAQSCRFLVSAVETAETPTGRARPAAEFDFFFLLLFLPSHFGVPSCFAVEASSLHCKVFFFF
jgi:hypothetical protein